MSDEIEQIRRFDEMVADIWAVMNKYDLTDIMARGDYLCFEDETTEYSAIRFDSGTVRRLIRDKSAQALMQPSPSSGPARDGE